MLPVRSADRVATLKITYDTSKVWEVALLGWGHDEPYAEFFEAATVDTHALFHARNFVGGANTDELAAALRVDAAGHQFISGTVVGPTGFNDVTYLARRNADGSAGWAKMLECFTNSWGDSDCIADYPLDDPLTGPGPDSMDMDEAGALYIAANAKLGSTSFSRALTLKIDPATGDILWSKAWQVEDVDPMLANDIAQANALTVHGGRVFVTGTEGGGGVLFLILDASDGSVIYQGRVELQPGSPDEGWTLVADGAGNLYIGGQYKNSKGLVFQLTGVDGATPALGWVKQVDLAFTGANVMSLDTDGTNLYVAGYGDDTSTGEDFDMLALSLTDGAEVWAKAFRPTGAGATTCNIVRVAGSQVIFGGKSAFSGFDTQGKDALLVSLSAAGAENWAGFYYTGKGAEEMATHSVKGIAVQGSTLYLAGQVYTGNNNGYRYAGYWYKGAATGQPAIATVVDHPKMGSLVSDITGGVLEEVTTGFQQDAAAYVRAIDAPNTPAAVVDDPPAWGWQTATDKHDGHMPDGDHWLQILTLQ
jgi:hypothetical protein